MLFCLHIDRRHVWRCGEVELLIGLEIVSFKLRRDFIVLVDVLQRVVVHLYDIFHLDVVAEGVHQNRVHVVIDREVCVVVGQIRVVCWRFFLKQIVKNF